MKNFLLFIFLVTFFMPGNIQAQTGSGNYIVSGKLLSVEDGLASRDVFCELQDSKGFIWFGTRNGLNRYDGKNFLLFTRNEGLQGSKILQLAQDDGDDLWINYGDISSNFLVKGEVDIMDISTHEVRSLSRFFKHLPFKETEVNYIQSGGKLGVIIRTSNNEIWRYTVAGGFVKWFELPHADSVTWDFPGVFSHGRYLISAIPGHLIDAQGDSVRTIDHLVSASFDSCTTLLGPFLFDGARQIGYLGYASNKVCSLLVLHNDRLEDVAKLPEGLDLTGPVFFMGCESSSEVVMLLTHGGLCAYYKEGFPVLVDRETLDRYPGIQIRQFFRDRTGKFWICTSAGVFISKVEPGRFSHYFTHKQIPLESGNQARGIYADTNGYVFANIWSHLCISDKDGNMKKPDITGFGLSYPLVAYGDSILVSLSYHILQYNIRKGNLVDMGGIAESWAAYPLNRNNFLFGNAHGVQVFDVRTKTITRIACNDSFSLPEFFYRFFRDEMNRLWAVTENGLYALTDSGCITKYYGARTNGALSKELISGLNDAYVDSRGIFWLATAGSGLLRWDRKTDSVRQFSQEQGFSSSILYRIEADNSHHLWISTDYGLARFNMVDFSVHTYTQKDGISNNEFNRISSFKSANGRMYFGGLDGVNGFNPDDFIEDTVPLNAPLRILGFTQFDAQENKLIDKTTALVKKTEIVLKPGDRFFNLEFGMLDYESEAHAYAYKIEGLDNQWNYISENSIRISGLPYGHFTLKVKGQNIRGQWSTDELHIPVLVVKPFYLRDWFFVLAGLSVSALLYIFVYMRTRQLAQDNIKLENTVANRTKELNQSLRDKDALLKEIHHRVKNNLQTISSLLDLQGRNIADEKARAAILEGQNRVHSIALIHQNLYQRETLDAIEFGGFMNDLAASIQAIFLKKGFEFKFMNEIAETYLDIDTAVPLGLIANELLTNCFKYGYGNGNNLEVRVSLRHLFDGEFIFELRDNGPGLPPDFDLESAKSLGMRLVNRLSEQLAGRFSYHYENGSVFEISFKTTEARRREE